jgi:AcrR family transcriptional regulator
MRRPRGRRVCCVFWIDCRPGNNQEAAYSGIHDNMSETRHRLPALARRRAVIESASRVFARSSYRGATTAEIAREAGVSEPILYRHFGSKRDLYLACLDEAWFAFRTKCDQALAEDPGNCLGAISDAYLARTTRIRLIDLWIQALTEAADDTVIAKAMRKRMHEMHRLIATVITRGQEAGTVHRERDSIAEAWLFIASGLLATIDHRLSGLIGVDLERVSASRRTWLAAD